MSAATLSRPRAPIARPRISSPLRRAFVRRAVAELRLRHPELRRPVTFDALLSVFAREGIDVDQREQGRRLGCAFAFPLGPGILRGVWLKPTLEGPLATWIAAHELAHHALHFTPEYFATRMLPLRPWWVAPTPDDLLERDQCEAEADFFADLLVGPALAALAHEQLAVIEMAA